MQNDNFGPEDITPGAYLRGYDSEKYFLKYDRDPEDSLAMLVRAIIAAHPNPKKCDEERFRKAVTALTGKTLSKRKTDDYDALIRMAWLYHTEKTRDIKAKVQIEPLAKSVMGENQTTDRGTPESVIKKLARDFKKHKIVLLARATSQQDWERMDHIRTLQNLTLKLNKAGIPADKTAIRPRLMSRVFSSGN